MDSDGDTGTDFLSTRQVADELGVGITTVNRWVRDGRLRPTVQGDGIRGARFFRRSDIDALDRELAS